MNSQAADIDNKLKVALAVVLGSATFIIIGLLLAVSQMLAAFLIMMVILAIVLPHHALISLFLVSMTIGSSFIIPFVKGRPLVWEAASALAWTGLPILYLLRRQNADAGNIFQNNKILLIAPFLYCIILIFLMRHHGVQSGSYGAEGAGLRRYSQQIICAVFPLLYISIMPSEKILKQLFVIQMWGTSTFFIGELSLNFLRGDLLYILAFLDITSDSFGFAVNAVSGGFRRFQSLHSFAIALVFLLMLRVPMKRWFALEGIWVLPTLVILVVSGLMSGHRYTLYTLGTVIIGVAWAQRFVTFMRFTFVFVLVGVGILFAYTFSTDLPDSIQRALTLLPNLEVSPQVAMDARGTLDGRSDIFKIGTDMIPDHYIIGRGFGMTQESIDILSRGMVQGEEEKYYSGMGVFYNGTLGLLVNTGIIGAIIMIGFILLGCILALRVIGLVRRNHWDDSFSRFAGVIASYFLSQAFTTLFLHGDVEMIMRFFGANAGMLLVIEYHLKKRIVQEQQDEEAPQALQPA